VQPEGEHVHVVPRALGQALQQPRRQQAGVLSEHAKQQLVEEVRDPLRIMATAAQRKRQGGELLGCLAGQLLAGLAWPQRVRRRHDRPQHPQRLLRVLQEVAQGEGVHDRGGVGEVGVDLEAVQVTHH
jgi:hypothetical protein